MDVIGNIYLSPDTLAWSQLIIDMSERLERAGNPRRSVAQP